MSADSLAERFDALGQIEDDSDTPTVTPFDDVFDKWGRYL